MWIAGLTSARTRAEARMEAGVKTNGSDAANSSQKYFFW